MVFGRWVFNPQFTIARRKRTTNRLVRIKIAISIFGCARTIVERNHIHIVVTHKVLKSEGLLQNNGFIQYIV